MNVYRFCILVFVVLLLPLSGCKKSSLSQPSENINDSDVVESQTYPHGTDRLSSSKNPDATVKPGLTIKSDSADAMADEMMP